jgi:fructose/tagatose bisphosphate aldolase
MTSLAGLVQHSPRRARRDFAISLGDLADRPWLLRLLADAGLSVVVAVELSLAAALESVGEASAVLVVADAGARSGPKLKDFVDATVRRVRSLSAHVGVGVVAGAPFNADLLPARTWLLGATTRPADVLAMAEAVGDHRGDHVEALRRWPRPAAAGPRSRRRPAAAAWRGAIPNFNVRHPGMLVSICRVAASAGTPVACEISPQEALAYFQNENGRRDHASRVRDVLGQLRDDVDFVRAALGCDVRLHLDHCDDPDLIVHALDAGFDSIMADGSGQSLSANVRFTRRAAALAGALGVAVEGEVGSLDPDGRRKTSKTLLADVRTFVEETGVDYLGVNVGQVHGSDYAYNRSRRALREIAELELTHGRHDVASLYRACCELDRTLAARGLRPQHGDRRCVQMVRSRLIDQQGSSIDAVLHDAYGMVASSSWPLVARLEHLWNEHRTALSARKARLYRDVAPAEVGLGGERGRFRYLDLDLLREVHAAVAGTRTRVVLHGGSSIPLDDLRLVGSCGVARVNFGSRPFAAFVEALSARCPTGAPAPGQAQLADVVRFLGEHGSDWRDWCRTPPGFLEPYQEELRRTYFAPLAERSTGEGR